MTSAQNRRLLLSGNKWFFWPLILLFVWSVASCDLLKKIPDDDPISDDNKDLGEIQGPVQRDPVTGEIKEVTLLTIKMDTIDWKTPPPGRFPVIKSEGAQVGIDDPDAGQEQIDNSDRRVFNIAMMLPFLADDNSPASKMGGTSEWAIQFYAGAKLAFEDLEQKGIFLNVSVHDTRASEQQLVSMLRSDPNIRGADLLIGPYRSSNARILADFAKQARKPVVSPYAASSTITNDNPYYIQLNPSLESHFEGILRHAKSSFQTEQIVLVARNRRDEVERLDEFQKINRQLSPAFDTATIRQFIVDDESADLFETEVSDYLNKFGPSVFIIPSWRNETFIYSFLRKLKLAQAQSGNDIYVYGMQQWADFQEVIDVDLMETLNVHISSYYYIDDYNDDIREFRNRFFEAYGDLPEEAAYVGYGTSYYFADLLVKYNGYFLDKLEIESRENLYTTYEFRKVLESISDFGEAFKRFERYENKYVHILQFRDYFFQPAD
jgi:ABC-type branched-subunit amino acid transport system substrate-binding protein